METVIFWSLIALFVAIILIGIYVVIRHKQDKEKVFMTYVAFGLGAVATLAGILALRPTGGGQPSEPIAEITAPTRGAIVGRCARIEGTAYNLSAGKTLVTAKYRTAEGVYWVEKVSGWQKPSAIKKWTANQFFNSGDGLGYTVFLFSVPLEEVNAAADDPAFRDQWAIPEATLPRTWEAVDSIGVNVDLEKPVNCG